MHHFFRLLISSLVGLMAMGCASFRNVETNGWASETEPRFSGVFQCPAFSDKTAQGHDFRSTGSKVLIELRNLAGTWIHSQVYLEQGNYEPGSVEDMYGPYRAQALVLDGQVQLLPIYRNNKTIVLRVTGFFDGTTFKWETLYPDYMTNEGKPVKSFKSVGKNWIDEAGNLNYQGSHFSGKPIVCKRL